MTRPHLHARFLTILERHKGLAQAIGVGAMAEQLGLGRGKNGQRMAQLVKAELVMKGHLIGSSCGKVSGWYWIVTEEEYRATMRQYGARFSATGKLMQRTKQNFYKQQSPQLGMF